MPLWVPDLRNKSIYNNIEFFPADERIVPFFHIDSNWGTIDKIFFKKISDNISPLNFAKIKKDYKEIIKNKFHTLSPVFNTIYLGIGSDGHTASLFPEKQKNLSKEPVLETQNQNHPHKRITLSYNTILNAEKVVFVIDDINKKKIVNNILGNNIESPSSYIIHQRKKATYLIINKKILED